jgi:hypothetical protein
LPICLKIAEHELFKFPGLRQVVAPLLKIFGISLGLV